MTPKSLAITGIAAAAAIGIFAAVSSCCSGFPIEDEEGTISEVINGSTVVLDDGLTVHLLGIAQGNSYTEEQLRKRYIGRNIRLTPDSQGDQTFESYNDEVYAYAVVTETGEALNRSLLTGAGKDAFSPVFVEDSLEAYQQIFLYNRAPLDDKTLAAKLKGSSILIFGEEDGMIFNGTGFFINGEGLAVSNNHVVHPGARYSVYLSDTQGNIDTDRALSIKSIVYASDHNQGRPDYTVFFVDLDPDTQRRVQHLRVANDELVAGEKIYTVGNPSPGYEILPMLFKDGVISSNQLDRQAKFSINMPITHGFSGAPIVNRYGEVIGIATSGYDNSNAQINFGTDMHVVRECLDAKNISYEGK